MFTKRFCSSKCVMISSVIFSVMACILTWLILGESSPFYGYFLYHVTFPNLVRQLLIVPYLLVMIVNPSTASGDVVLATTAEFLQWLLVGYLLLRVICRRRLRKESPTN